MTRKRITIAILALGGQGGGVLSDWIVALAADNGWTAQATSVPGVAQRTGSTVYYLELFPEEGAQVPVLALSPVPGDVDIVIASELMEAGRAILRGFVTPERTTLITSTHRVYAVSEKSAMGDGRAREDKVLEAAMAKAKMLLSFDMEDAANRVGCMISAVMFGALARSEALPFLLEAFEQVIRKNGVAVDTNLAGLKAAQASRPAAAVSVSKTPTPTTPAGWRLLERIRSELPPAVHTIAVEGVRRLMDYQDVAYAELYLDRIARLAKADLVTAPLVTCETARHLALWMSYEDTIRVADLKTRASRFARVNQEIKSRPGQTVAITEFMHPRLQEICETLPRSLGLWILERPRLCDRLSLFFRKGRQVTTSHLGWFLILRLLASLRRWRRGSLRFHEEDFRIREWLGLIHEAIVHDSFAALSLVRLQQLIKGYGDTFSRGLGNYSRIISVYHDIRGLDDVAQVIDGLREAALQDEEGAALAIALQSVPAHG